MSIIDDDPDKRWTYIKAGRGLFNGPVHCTKCNGICFTKDFVETLMNQVRTMYKVWSCLQCQHAMALFSQSHFRTCPMCTSPERDTKSCKWCYGRGWLRL